jgi:hypothetical protein
VRAQSGVHSVPVWKRPPVMIGAAAVALIIVVAGLTTLVARWVAGSGGGEIQLSIARPSGGTLVGAGVRCGTQGSECSARLPRGESVEFLAEPDAGFRFTGFTGDCAPGGRITMNAPRTCGATFEAEPEAVVVKHLLSIAPPRGGTVVGVGGTINCGTRGKDCAVQINHGTPVKLEGWADPGFTFRGFTGQCAQGGEVQIVGPLTCAATFTPNAAIATSKPTGTTAPPTGSRAGSTGTSTLPTTGGGAGGAGGTQARGGTGGDFAAPPAPPKVTPSDDGPIAPPPPPKPLPPDVVARKAIEDTLERYRVAYEDLNVVGMQRVFPSAADRFKAQFQAYKDMEYSFAGPPKYVQLDPLAGTAMVEIETKQTATPKVGSRRSNDSLLRFNLKKNGADDEWIITSSTVK